MRFVPVIELSRKLSAFSLEDKLYMQTRAAIEQKLDEAKQAMASELLIRTETGDIATEKNSSIIKLLRQVRLSPRSSHSHTTDLSLYILGLLAWLETPCCAASLLWNYSTADVI